MQWKPAITQVLRNTLFFCGSCLIISCASEASEGSGTEAITVVEADHTIPFAGYWLSEEYYSSIRRSRSPRLAQDGAEMIILPASTEGETMWIGNFHEGAAPMKVLRTADGYELVEIVEDGAKGTSTPINLISPGMIRIGASTLVKIDPHVFDGSPLILEEILFKGHYENAEGEVVEFRKDGHVNGLGTYTSYEPVIDYFDAGMQVDQVGMYTASDELEWLGFQFRSDTLELYELDCLTFDSTMDRCVEVAFGRLMHQMWKVGESTR